ncbi:hypothetical protein CNR34_00111 [Pseudomonas phage nickie]|uniref:Uncharacterized protein n=1 Tax=Pseudomonas phage nickie TaxID=2048977 RepID=A0A2H4P780_9CAUD|nr:hypothetical protein FDJ16_gp054 [Pseudomonas phage nickie]ATW58044.1 hypothetical protein CNR34_00111 [Pseudomonas phage nickie]
MSGLAVIGWIVIAAIAVYCVVVAIQIFRFSLGFAGKVAGEFYFLAVVAVIFIWLSYYTFPFHISMVVAQ